MRRPLSYCSRATAFWLGGDSEATARGSFAAISSWREGQLDLWSDARVSERLLACLLYTSPSPRDGLLSRMPSSA